MIARGVTVGRERAVGADSAGGACGCTAAILRFAQAPVKGHGGPGQNVGAPQLHLVGSR